MSTKDKFSHYYKTLPTNTVDVYRTLKAFEVTDPCIQHAVKKLLVAGGRGDKDIDKDIEEAIASLQRFQEMRREDQNFASACAVSEMLKSAHEENAKTKKANIPKRARR